MLNPTEITPISQVKIQSELGYSYTVEGVVTSNASGYDHETAFFDCIYVQDETGGINLFPVTATTSWAMWSASPASPAPIRARSS